MSSSWFWANEAYGGRVKNKIVVCYKGIEYNYFIFKMAVNISKI